MLLLQTETIVPQGNGSSGWTCLRVQRYAVVEARRSFHGSLRDQRPLTRVAEFVEHDVRLDGFAADAFVDVTVGDRLRRAG